jgi:hypothetical protein
MLFMEQRASDELKYGEIYHFYYKNPLLENRSIPHRCIYIGKSLKANNKGKFLFKGESGQPIVCEVGLDTLNLEERTIYAEFSECKLSDLEEEYALKIINRKGL